jgi:hypothetical protein
MYRLLLASLLVIPLVSGCVYGTDAIRDEVDSIAWDLRPAELDTQAEIAFGRGILGMASTVARWSDDHDAEFAADMLDDIEKVDVGIYEVFGSGRHGPNGLTQDGLEELRDLGWRPVVRTSERRDGSRWVLYRTERGRDQMLVVGIEEDELVVLRLTGDLGGIMDSAIRREDDLIAVAHDVHDDW